MILKRNLKLNEVGEAGTALKNIEVAEIYSRSSQGGQAGSEPAGGAAGSYLMFLGDGGHLRRGSFVMADRNLHNSVFHSFPSFLNAAHVYSLGYR